MVFWTWNTFTAKKKQKNTWRKVDVDEENKLTHIQAGTSNCLFKGNHTNLYMTYLNRSNKNKKINQGIIMLTSWKGRDNG